MLHGRILTLLLNMLYYKIFMREVLSKLGAIYQYHRSYHAINTFDRQVARMEAQGAPALDKYLDQQITFARARLRAGLNKEPQSVSKAIQFYERYREGTDADKRQFCVIMADNWLSDAQRHNEQVINGDQKAARLRGQYQAIARGWNYLGSTI
jgi:hypothetical protein